MNHSISFRIRRGAFSTSIMLLSSASFCAASDTMTKERMLSEYPKALAALDARFSHASGHGIQSLLPSRRDNSAPVKRTKVEYSFSGGNGLVILTSLDGNDPEGSLKSVEAKKDQQKFYQSAYGFNGKYSFWITKKTPISDYVIQMLEPDPARSKRLIFNEFGYALRCATTANLFPISQLLAGPQFRIDRVADDPTATDLGKRWIDFTVLKKAFPNPESVRNNASRISTGWIVASPGDQWILCDYGYVVTAPNSNERTWVGHVEYKKGTTGEPVPVKSSVRAYKGRFKADPAVVDSSAVPYSGKDFEFTNWSFGEKPSDDFTLSAFGLPEFGEPAAATRSRLTPWWLFASAAVAIVAAFALRRMTRATPTDAGAGVRPNRS